MGYQTRAGSSRNYGRGRGIPRSERAKSKARKRKRRSSSSSALQEDHVTTSEEAVNKTLNALRSLGKQKFALPPFSAHLNRWLVNLKDVLSEFESSPNITIDDQFEKERSQILSNVELDLEKRRDKEASAVEAAKSLSDDRILLERIEKDYVTATKEINERKDAEIKKLSSNADDIKKELNHLAQMKTGIFRAISKRDKAQKEEEATRRLNTAQNELALAAQHFEAEQEKLRTEYEKKKQTVIERIQDHEKEIESQEIDGSSEARRTVCDALVNAVDSFLQRKGLSHQ